MPSKKAAPPAPAPKGYPKAVPQADPKAPAAPAAPVAPEGGAKAPQNDKGKGKGLQGVIGFGAQAPKVAQLTKPVPAAKPVPQAYGKAPVTPRDGNAAPPGPFSAELRCGQIRVCHQK